MKLWNWRLRIWRYVLKFPQATQAYECGMKIYFLTREWVLHSQMWLRARRQLIYPQLKKTLSPVQIALENKDME